MFHVRGFRCDQVLNPYRKSAPYTQSGPFRVRLTKNLITVKIRHFSFIEKRPLKNREPPALIQENQITEIHEIFFMISSEFEM